MKKKLTLSLAFGAVMMTAACGSKQQPVVTEVEQSTSPVAKSPAEAAPVQASPQETTPPPAWKPAPAAKQHPRTAKNQRTETPAAAPAPTTPQQTAAATPPPAQEQPTSRYNPPAAAPAPPPPPPREPQKVTLASGSILPVRINESLSSEKSQAGDRWTGTLTDPLVINGLVIAERGARVEGRVATVSRAGRVKGNAELTVEATSFTTSDGQRVDVDTGAYLQKGKDSTKKDLGKVAIGAGIGAAIGAIAGGGRGAGIGAGSGAAAGTGVVLATRGGAAEIPAETVVKFRVASPVTITEKIK